MKSTVVGSMLLVIVPAIIAAASPDLVASTDKSFCERVF